MIFSKLCFKDFHLFLFTQYLENPFQYKVYTCRKALRSNGFSFYGR